MRLNRYRKSKAAYDHLDLAERRDYTEPGDGDDFEGDDEAEVTREEDAEEEVVKPDYTNMNPDKATILPHEKLLRSMAEEDAAKAPTQEDMPAVDHQGGYRVTRASAVEPAQADTEQDAADAAARRHRRSRKVDEE